MQRLKEEFLDRMEKFVPLTGTHILEVGCGAGKRSVAIAERCSSLEAIEPDSKLVETATANNSRDNIRYQVGGAEQVPFNDDSFDVAIFTLSLHHVPLKRMRDALSEARRVVKTGGHIVFLEPAFDGSYFESEILFDAGDGDEREEKKNAYAAISSFEGVTKITEIDDETVFQFDSTEDFIQTFAPKKNIGELEGFLSHHNYVLNAKRRVCIFKK